MMEVVLVGVSNTTGGDSEGFILDGLQWFDV